MSPHTIPIFQIILADSNCNYQFFYSIIDKPIVGRRHITDKPHHPEKRLHPIQAQAVEDPATGTAKAGVITTERQIIPPNFVNLLALVIRLGPQLVVGGKNKGVAGPSPVVVMAKTDIAKWRCSPLDKKLELPITIHTRPIHPPKYFLVIVSLFSLIYVTFGRLTAQMCAFPFPF